MNYFQFLDMRPEVSLIAILLIVFLYDLIATGKARKFFQPLVCILLAAQAAYTIIPGESVSLFGGMYQNSPICDIVKAILTAGTVIVVMQANIWLERKDTSFKQGEFYILLISTLLGMYFMISAGHFLLFFLGMETASIPLACLVAFDKYKHYSFEAGAKYILMAMFSTGIMLFGISMIYGSVGSLYFEDIPAALTGSPLQIMAMIFFLAGLGFKISLVPFHMWTADAYQGAPTNVTSYLSVISKGSAAFVLMTILIKVFAPMITEWQYFLYTVIVLSITIANLFAIRQTDLKRFMAYSSISQAGYIALAVISGSALGMTSLIFYVLVYIVSNLSIFGIINAIEQNSAKNTVDRDDYAGLYKTNPKLSFLMTLALFSLAGIPPFAGFFSKFFVFMAAFQAGYWLLVFIALANTVISLYYYLLIVKAMYITPNDTPIATFKSDAYTRLSLFICTAGILLLGLFSCIYNGINVFAFGM